MTTFPRSQHVNIARRFLDKSNREFANGDELNGAELLWGAVAHALIAVALEYGWHFDSHGALRNVAVQLETSQERPQWRSDFSMAERFHTHFYHGRLTYRQIEVDRPKVARFVNRLFGLLVVK